MTKAAVLQQQIESSLGRKIVGVSVGRWEDRSTWRIDFTPDATEDEQQTAQAMLGSFDPADVPESSPRSLADLEAEVAALRAALFSKGVVTEAEVDAGREARVHES